MVLNLVSPGLSNFLKDWPDQNTVNCDLIDNFAGPCLTTHGLGTYTPVLSASTTDPSLGTGGALLGRYYRIFDQVWVWGEFRFGTASSIGSGNYQVSLPFSAKTNLQSTPPFTTPVPIGHALLYDLSADAGRQPLVAALINSDNMVFLTRGLTGAGGRAVTHNTPIIWSGGVAPGGDGIFWSVRYQRQS